MWNGLRVSYIQFHYLSLSLEPITWRASPLGVCDSNLSGACGGLTLSGCLPPPHHPTLPISSSLCPSLSLHSSKQGQLRTVLAPCLHLKLPPITALWHPHQHKHVDSPSPFPLLSATHPVNGKEGCFGLTSSGGMSGWRCLWRRNTWVTGGYGAGFEHQEKEENSHNAYTGNCL